MAPVNTPRAFFRLDVHLVQVDVHLGDVHLEAVGQQLDGFPHGAIARPSRDGEQGLSPNGSCRENRREFPSAGVVAKLAGLSTSTITTTHPKAKNPRTCPRKKLNRGAFKKKSKSRPASSYIHVHAICKCQGNVVNIGINRSAFHSADKKRD